MNEMWQGLQRLGERLSLERVALAAVILTAGWLLWKLGEAALQRSAAGRRMQVGERYALGRLLRYILLGASLAGVLAALGVNLQTVAVLAGALGIGIGFGLQGIVANFVAGLILLFERPIQVGDRVSLGSIDADAAGQTNGFVRAISLRATTITTMDNITLIVPNSELIQRTIVNWSLKDPRIRLRLPIGVAYGSDLDLVTRTLTDVGREHPDTLEDPAPEVWLIATGDSSLDFQLMVWIASPNFRGRIESELRLEIVRRFRTAGVTIPFPQRDVHVMGGAAGAAGPG